MAQFSSVFLPFYLILCFSALPRRVLAQCYYPGGAWAGGHVPCDPHAYATLCCPRGWTCFSNNLCVATDPSVILSEIAIGTSYRGACTNPNWNTSACGDFCLSKIVSRIFSFHISRELTCNAGNPVNDNSGALVSCGSEAWCCQPDYNKGNCDCKSGHGTFSLSEGHAVTIIGVGNLVHTATAATGPAGSTTTATTTRLSTVIQSSSTTLPA